MSERKEVLLSKRMQMSADLVTKGNILADIGCDHGFVSIYLVEQNICPKVIAMDVNEGPLLRAKEHIEERALGEYIDIRLSDGMENLKPGEADSILIAGMGGRLVIRILSDHMDQAKQLKELILQPQSDLNLVRRFLNNNGFHILKEDMTEENGKFYPVIKVSWKEEIPKELQEAEEWYGPCLLKEQNPVLLTYLQKEKNKFTVILREIEQSSNHTENTDKDLIQKRMELIDKALVYFHS